MEDNSAFTYKKEKSFGSVVMSIMFSHFGLFVLVAGYAAAGAWAFVELELGFENERYLEKQIKAYEVNETIEYTTSIFLKYRNKPNLTFEQYEKLVNRDLKRMENFILDAISNHDYDGDIMSWEYDWTFMKSLLLTMSIMTTIGYGHIAPKTFEGQMFCIMYAMIGCPLFLVFLANLGDAMATGFIFIYSRCCCRWCRSKRYESEMPPNASKKMMKLVGEDTVGEEEYMPTSKMFVPIVLNIVILHGFIVVGGVLFSIFEYWDLISSYYFTFVTLSTIGYGDLVPGNAFMGDDSMTSTLKMLLCVSYIVFGMALLSMCVNLMQEQIVEKCKWATAAVSGAMDDAVKPKKDTPDEENPKEHKPIPGSSPFRRPGSSVGPIPEEGDKLPGALE